MGLLHLQSCCLVTIPIWVKQNYMILWWRAFGWWEHISLFNSLKMTVCKKHMCKWNHVEGERESELGWLVQDRGSSCVRERCAEWNLYNLVQTKDVSVSAWLKTCQTGAYYTAFAGLQFLDTFYKDAEIAAQYFLISL